MSQALQLTLSELVTLIKSMDLPQELDQNWQAVCPCFRVTLIVNKHSVNFWGRCNKVAESNQDLYVWGNLADKEIKLIAQVLKKQLDSQKWYSKYTLKGEPEKIWELKAKNE